MDYMYTSLLLVLMNYIWNENMLLLSIYFILQLRELRFSTLVLVTYYECFINFNKLLIKNTNIFYGIVSQYLRYKYILRNKSDIFKKYLQKYSIILNSSCGKNSCDIRKTLVIIVRCECKSAS